jgi:hypothetical protein
MRPQGRDIAAFEMNGPDVGSISLTIMRAAVDLPQPDSPTTPSVSPAKTEKENTVDGKHRALAAAETGRGGGRNV